MEKGWYPGATEVVRRPLPGSSPGPAWEPTVIVRDFRGAEGSRPEPIKKVSLLVNVGA